MGSIYGVVTVILMAVFIGIVVWAWREERTHDFEAAARLPLGDDVQGEAGTAQDGGAGR